MTELSSLNSAGALNLCVRFWKLVAAKSGRLTRFTLGKGLRLSERCLFGILWNYSFERYETHILYSDVLYRACSLAIQNCASFFRVGAGISRSPLLVVWVLSSNACKALPSVFRPIQRSAGMIAGLLQEMLVHR